MRRNVRVLNKEHGIFSIFKEAGLDLLLATSGRIQDSLEDSICVFLLLGRMRHVNIHRFLRSFAGLLRMDRLMRILGKLRLERGVQHKTHVPSSLGRHL